MYLIALDGVHQADSAILQTLMGQLIDDGMPWCGIPVDGIPQRDIPGYDITGVDNMNTYVILP